MTGFVAAVVCVIKGRDCRESWHYCSALIARLSPRRLSANISAWTGDTWTEDNFTYSECILGCLISCLIRSLHTFHCTAVSLLCHTLSSHPPPLEAFVVSCYLLISVCAPYVTRHVFKMFPHGDLWSWICFCAGSFKTTVSVWFSVMNLHVFADISPYWNINKKTKIRPLRHKYVTPPSPAPPLPTSSSSCLYASPVFSRGVSWN